MRTKRIFLVLLIVFLMIFISINSYAEEINILEIKQEKKTGETSIVKEHDELSKKIKKLKEKEYLFPDLLAIKDPYNMNTTGLYIYFETLNPSYVEYEIETLDSNVKNISRGLYSKKEYQTNHEYQIVGAVAGKRNKIKITTTDIYGIKNSISFIYDAPDIKSKSYKGLYMKDGNSKVSQLDGFYILPTSEGFSLLLDRDGNIRGELATRFAQFKIDDGYLYTLHNTREILKIDPLGKVETSYGSKDFFFHHDFTISDNDLLVLATNKKVLKGENRINDSIVKINIDTGKIEEIIDFNNLLPELYRVSNGLVRHNVLSGKGKRDIMHPNTIDIDKNKNILISSRETSSIIKINMSGEKPELNYIISSPKIWDGIGNYDKKLLREIGESKAFTGQHSTYIQEDDSLEEGQYYISVFDNNSAIMESRPDFKWEGFEGSYKVPKIIDKNTYVPNGIYSYFQKYLIDENKKTYKLVESLELPFSFFQSSAQEINNHIIYNSSWKGAFGEFDGNRKLIRSYMLKNNNRPYRVGKMDFKNYWFD